MLKSVLEHEIRAETETRRGERAEQQAVSPFCPRFAPSTVPLTLRQRQVTKWNCSRSVDEPVKTKRCAMLHVVR